LLIDGGTEIDTVTLNGSLTNLTSAGLTVTSENINLNANVSTVGRPIALTGAMTVGADISISAPLNSVNLTGAIESTATARDLSVSGAIVRFVGTVGATNAIDSLVATATNRTEFQNTVRANNISVSGAARISNNFTAVTDDISLAGPTLLFGDAVLTSGGGVGDDIVISSTLAGNGVARDLTLNAGSGNVSASVAVGALLDVFNVTANTASFTGSVTANSIAMTANVAAASNLRAETGNLAITGNLALNGALVLFAAPNANVSVSGSTTGTGANLTVQATSGILNEAIFSGAVSGVNTLQIAASGANIVTFGSTISANNVLLTGATINLTDDVIALVDDVTVTGNVVLLGGTLADPVTLTSGLGSGDDVRVSGTINAQVAMLRNLSIAAGAGTASLNGNVGATTALQSLSVNASSVSAQQLRTQSGGITLVVNDAAWAGVVSGTGVLSISPQSSGREIRVGGTSSGTSVNLSSAELGLIADGFSAIRIGLASTAGPVVVGSAITFLDQVQLTGSQVNVNQALSAGNNRVTLIANELNLAADVTGAGPVVIDTLSDGTTVRLGGVADSGATFLDLTASDLSRIVNGHSSITIIGSVNPATDNIEVLSPLTFSDPLTLQTSGSIVVPFNVTAGSVIDPVTLTLQGNVSLGGNLTTFGRRIQATGNITLTGASLIDTTGAGAVAGGQQILVGGTINGGFNLALTAGNSTSGIIQISGNVGDVTPLGALTVVSAANRAVFGGSVNAADVDITSAQTRFGGNVTSAADIDVVGNVLLTADSVMTSGGSAADNVTITGTVASFTTGVFDLTVNAGLGDVQLTNTVGGNIDSLSLIGDVVTLGNTTTANSVDVTATTLQIASAIRANTGSTVITGNVNLNGGPVSFFFGNGGNLTVSGTLTGTGQSLTIRALTGSPVMGSVTIGGAVSGIGALTVTSSGSTISANITVSGNISWTVPEAIINGDNLVIDAGVLITSTAGNVYLFAADTVTNNGTVTAPLGTVTIISGGNDEIPF